MAREQYDKNFNWINNRMFYRSSCCNKECIKEVTPGGYECYTCAGCGQDCDRRLKVYKDKRNSKSEAKIWTI